MDKRCGVHRVTLHSIAITTSSSVSTTLSARTQGNSNSASATPILLTELQSTSLSPEPPNAVFVVGRATEDASMGRR